jgi:AsmA protein
MKKAIVIVGKIVAVIVVLLVAAAIALTVFFNPNDYKGEIAKYVKDKTGRELKIDGNISLSFFPWIGLDVGKTVLGNAPGFGDAPFAQVQEVGVKVKLLPLFRKELVADTIVLKGLDLNLIRNKAGRTDWQDLTTASAEKEKSAPPPAPGAPSPQWGLDISGVQVSNARVSWDDQQSGSRYTLEKLNLDAGHLGAGGKPVDLKLGFDFIQKPGAKPMPVALSSKVAFNMVKQTMDVKDLQLALAGLKLEGQVQGTSIQTKPNFTGKLEIPEFVPRRTMNQLNLPVPQTADSSVLGKASLSADFSATDTSANLEKLVVRLDDTTIRGKLSVKNFQAPAIGYEVNVDAIDLDRYLPPQEKKAPAKKASLIPAANAAEPAGKAGGSGAAEAPLIPVQLLRSLNLTGTATIGKLKVYNLRSEQVSITTTAKNGNVRAHPATAKLYGGSYSGDVGVNVQGSAPKLSMDEKLMGVKAEPLFKDLTGKDLISGTANLSAKLNASGNTMDAFRRTLGGLIGFSFTDGAVKGVNIAQMIRKANAVLHGEPPPPGEPEQTDFAELKGTATAKNGVITNNDLEAKSPLLRITGSGAANLVTEDVDYLVKAVIVGTLKGQGGASLEKLKGVTIPVKVTGKFEEPKYEVDLAQALTETQKKRIEEKKQEVEEKAREKLQDKLKGLFK